jgi:hypothetical protein
MNNLPKAKRDQLILISVFTVGIIAALIFFVMDAQRVQLKQTAVKTETMRTKLNLADKLSREEPQLTERLQNSVKSLGTREALLAPERDTYAWLLQNMAQFLSTHRGAGITPAGISQPDVTEAMLLPKFNYKAATFHVKASGFFHDFGRFVADLETEFPYVRVQNVDMVRTSGGALSDPEKLNISFDMVMLMQPSTPIENR